MHSVFHQNCPPYLRDLVEFVNDDLTKRRLRSVTTRTAATVGARTKLVHLEQSPTALTSHRLASSIPKAAKTYLFEQGFISVCFPSLFLYFYMYAYIGGLQMLVIDI